MQALVLLASQCRNGGCHQRGRHTIDLIKARLKRAEEHHEQNQGHPR